jgi:hypothetical protein
MPSWGDGETGYFSNDNMLKAWKPIMAICVIATVIIVLFVKGHMFGI